MSDLLSRAAALDAADPLAPFRDRFLTAPASDLLSYLDGNSLGRPLEATARLMDEFIREQWGGRLIRGWTDGWLDWPLTLGDRLGAIALGAAAGQTVIADSTTVLIYKLARAAVDARPGRNRVVLDTDNFPTDRYVLEGIAAERGLELVWISTDPATGVHPEQVAEVVDERTALVLFSHVAYRSGWLADIPAINRIAHEAGALTMWDLCHSAGSVPVSLDEWGVDLAVGCTYKYLNGGPGAPAFAYLRRELQDELRQPITGWMGHRAAFEMGHGHEPAPGVRALLSGTPPILAMVPLHANLDMLAEAGIEAVRAKSLLLTGYVLDIADTMLADTVLAGRGVEVVSPRDPERRGGHVTLRRPGFEQFLEPLWDSGVIPDYRRPDGLRIGPAPLSTSFTEVHQGLSVLRDLLEKHR
ncbi:putative kynureninase [Actinoplanes missouriensis 431]|uniref:Kynureninase n=1 Tax=Actinoplanes missouriensis (strain ATCC 14538 / DSM 43046 / CBS 188.64 / JCM 3121 / NBRC 102363 / NCIMB 12654 / NRRL B-3342 / UNCC 431) TaxID=512565 RepID=I0HFL7_ACTM4|nr:kynureninase [Actinoplanes missouriensis]BAL91804.1 putative kynureninase [Actinoplanes missouriensis 431]